ncbi:MAG TPA: hypothetical protein VJ717_17570 [Gemmatimonadaceae bacterium]|nr:hypothetical protein [Gemmatimonadaceae bacterium]
MKHAAGLRRARRARVPNAVEWLATAAVAALLGTGAGRLLRADEPPANGSDASALVQALGAPTGVLAVLNPVTCALTAQDAQALNRAATTPGMRVVVLLAAVTPHDSVLQRVRRDFALAPTVHVAAAAVVNPQRLPDVFRRPFVAVVVRGHLRHAAWGESLKSLGDWLPTITGTSS